MADESTDALVRTFVQSRRLWAVEPEEPVAIEVSGDFGETTDLVSRTSMTLLTTPGRYAEGHATTIVPFVHVKIEGIAADKVDESEEGRTIFRHSLPLENAAYLVANLSTDLKLTCAHIARMADADQVEPKRLAMVRHLASHTVHEMLNCIYLITHALGDGEPPKQAPAAASPRPVKRLRKKSAAPATKRPAK